MHKKSILKTQRLLFITTITITFLFFTPMITLADEPVKEVAVSADELMSETTDWQFYEQDGLRVRYPDDWHTNTQSSRADGTTSNLEVADEDTTVRLIVDEAQGLTRSNNDDDRPHIIQQYEAEGYFIEAVTIKGFRAWEITPNAWADGLCREVVIQIFDSAIRFQQHANGTAGESLTCHRDKNFDLMVSSFQLKVGGDEEAAAAPTESRQQQRDISAQALNYNRQAAYNYAARWWSKWSNSDGRYYNSVAGIYRPGDIPADGAHFLAHFLEAGGFPIHNAAGQGHGDPIVFRISTQRNYVLRHPDANTTSRSNLRKGDVIYLYDSSLRRGCWGETVIRMSGSTPYVAVHSVKWAGVWRAGIWNKRYDTFYCRSKRTTSYEFVRINSSQDTSKVTGQIVNQDGDPIPNVVVSLGDGLTATTDENGYYVITDVPYGNHTLNIIGHGTNSPISSHPITVKGDTTTVPPIEEPTYSIVGQVKDVSSLGGRIVQKPLRYIEISGGEGNTAVTVFGGVYTITGLIAGQYTVKPSPSKRSEKFSICWYEPKDKPAEIINSDVVDVDFLRMCRTKTPIVFVHGWQGMMPQQWSSPCKDIGEGGANKTFSGVDEIFKNKDYPVYFAPLKSSICHTPRIQNNVSRLKNTIDTAKNETNNDKVIVIAHSMGGIVSRAYIEGDTYEDDVIMLFTYGSPHQGAEVEHVKNLALTIIFAPDVFGATACGFILPFPENLACTAAALLPDWAVALALEAYLDGLFGLGGQKVAEDLSIEGMETFNKIHSTRTNGVRYEIDGGSAPNSSRNDLGKDLNQILPGDDDGFIQTHSSTVLPGVPLTQTRITDEVHVLQLGDRSYFERDGGLSKSYNECIKKILIDGKDVCDNVEGRSRQLETQEQYYTDNVPLLLEGLAFGQTITRTIGIDGEYAALLVSWGAGTPAIELIAPNGEVITKENIANFPNISYDAGDSSVIYTLSNIESGIWKLVVHGNNIPSEGVLISTFATFETEAVFAADTVRPWYKPGERATITATIGTTPFTSTVATHIRYTDGTTQTVEMVEAKSGSYQADITVPGKVGYAKVNMVIQGVATNSIPFEREEIFLFQISPNGLSLSGSYDDNGLVYQPNPSYYEALLVTTTVNAVYSGNVALSAKLIDKNGSFVAHTNRFTAIATGSNEIVLKFDGRDIYKSQLDGPYTVTDVLLVDSTDGLLPVEEANNVHVTQPYSWQSFGPPNSGIILVQNASVIHTFIYTGDLGYIEMPSGKIEQFDNLVPGQYTIQQDPSSMPNNSTVIVQVKCFDLYGASKKVNLNQNDHRFSFNLDHNEYLVCSLLTEGANYSNDENPKNEFSKAYLPMIAK